VSFVQQVDVAVLGAGAAGLMCAIEAGKRGRRVLLIDHADKIGKKILISGGGRCNFTNMHARPENFISANPHFAKSALARFTPADMIAMVERHGIPYHEKTLGQLFCDRSAQDIVKMLERECADAGVRMMLSTTITKIAKTDRGFLVESSAGEIRAASVVVATGGLSIPKMGATGFGYDLAGQFDLGIVECRPGLVPLVFSGEDRDAWCDLAGLSLEVVASAGSGKKAGASFREKMLVTHRGLSGPVMLQVSSYWKAGQVLSLDMSPGLAVMEPLLARNARRDDAAAMSALRAVMPARMAERWLAMYPPADWTNPSIAAFEQRLHAWPVMPAGTEGYAKAEVTTGGVDTNELDAKTMQARKVPGLFQWAWASGVSAGLAA
jgi:predicted Rossmann fold flavoprotein